MCYTTMINIREARKIAGLTQKRLSEKYNIPLRTIEEWEAGRRTPPSYVQDLLVDKIMSDYKNENREVLNNE